ncbi:MAG: glycosyltransferase [Mastigocoleus sp.]
MVANINEYTGGPAVVVTNLAEFLLNHGISSHIFTLDYQNWGQQVESSGVTLHSYAINSIAQYLGSYHPNAGRILSELASTQFDLIHNHGLWKFPNIYARQCALENSLPLIISPHGMLESWSLNYHYKRKILAWLFYEQKNLASAAVLHATSIQELSSIRRFGLNNPVAVIPNGVHIENLDKQYNKENLTNLFPELKDKKWLMFISRIHPKKGLDNLLFTWKELAKLFDEWHLVIAGPDSVGYSSQLKSLVKELELENRVTFTGVLSGEIKKSALSNADLFVLPSHSENFGIVIAESLSYAVPVITTKCTPWQDLHRYDCGWWIEDNQKALTTALIEGMQISDNKRKMMGLKGRKLVQRKYSWDHIAKEMVNVYQWMIGGGNSPHLIHF